MSGHFQLRQAWDRIHQTESASELPDEDLVAFMEHLQSRLSAGATFLDVGCGRGRNEIYLSQSQFGFQLYACDLSLSALAVAKGHTQKAGSSVSFQGADLIRLPYANDSFVAAICRHVLPYHCKADLFEGIRELRRVLQPNGWLYLDLLDCEDAEYGHGQRLEEHTFLDPDGMPIHFSSRQEISELSEGLALQRLDRTEWKSSLGSDRVKWTVWATKQTMSYP